MQNESRNKSFPFSFVGTIVSAAIINEIIAVLLAKAAFRRAGEIDPQQTQKPHPTA